MRFDLVASAPEVFAGWLEASILGRARGGPLEIVAHNLRDWALDRHGTIDDTPYGGGAGMVLRPEPLTAAIEAVRALSAEPGCVCLMTPQGEVFSQGLARELSALPRLILVCGRYEGVDERVREQCVEREISVGDYVLTGGEVAAMAVVEAVGRLVPGVVGAAESLVDESFAEPLLEYPHYTRPAEFRGAAVPAVLLAGHHERVRLWRRLERLRRTLERRPELLAQRRLSDEDRRLLARIV